MRYFLKMIYTFSIMSLLITSATAQQNGEWPAFHGTDRTNKSQETGLLKQWPENGPTMLFEIAGLGEGYSGVVVADGFIFTAGRVGDETYVFAFDMNGKPVWRKSNGAAWETDMSWARAYTGPRGTPTYSDGVLYHLGETGRLTAFDSKTGNEIWVANLPERFNADTPEYGYSESVFVEGDRLYCNPAGKSGFMVCLNKRDGSLIWANTDIPGVAGYTSSIPADFGGYHQLINFSGSYVYGVDSADGKLLWRVPCENGNKLNCTDAIYYDGHVFVSAGYAFGSMLVKLNASGGAVTPQTVWKSELMDNHHGGVILHEGYIYGAGQNSRGWFCLDLMTGKEMWKDRGKGTITYADGMLYMVEENGDIRLVTASPESIEVAGSFECPEGGKGMYWAHPVVCGGKLYIRHTDKVFVFAVK